MRLMQLAIPLPSSPLSSLLLHLLLLPLFLLLLHFLLHSPLPTFYKSACRTKNKLMPKHRLSYTLLWKEEKAAERNSRRLAREHEETRSPLLLPWRFVKRIAIRYQPPEPADTRTIEAQRQTKEEEEEAGREERKSQRREQKYPSNSIKRFRVRSVISFLTLLHKRIDNWNRRQTTDNCQAANSEIDDTITSELVPVRSLYLWKSHLFHTRTRTSLYVTGVKIQNARATQSIRGELSQLAWVVSHKKLCDKHIFNRSLKFHYSDCIVITTIREFNTSYFW